MIRTSSRTEFVTNTCTSSGSKKQKKKKKKTGRGGAGERDGSLKFLLIPNKIQYTCRGNEKLFKLLTGLQLHSIFYLAN